MAACSCTRRLLLQTYRSSTYRRVSAAISASNGGLSLRGTRTHRIASVRSLFSDSNGVFHPRRSVMYIPASDERKTRKAVTLKIDTIVFDLEDGVAMSQKEKARQHVRSAIANCRTKESLSSRSEHAVRVNGVESGMLQADLEGVFGGQPEDGTPHALFLPKVDNVEHLLQLDLALAFFRGPSLSPIPLFILVESPSGVLNLKEICIFGTEKAKHFVLSAITFGSDDFIAHMGGVRTEDAKEVLFARQNVVMHAKAFGLDAVDLVEIDYKDLDHLKVQSEEGYRMGYTGKQVIHPDQVPIVQKAFSPKLEQVKWASGLIEAYHHHQESGKGAFVYEGKMIDRPSLLQAENLVRLQQAIDAA